MPNQRTAISALSAQQRAALKLLSSGLTVNFTALVLNVSARTILDWLIHHTIFRAALVSGKATPCRLIQTRPDSMLNHRHRALADEYGKAFAPLSSASEGGYDMTELYELRKLIREKLLRQGSCPKCGNPWIAALGEIYYCPADCGWEVNLFDDEEVLRQADLLTNKRS